MECDLMPGQPRKRRSWLWLQIIGGLLAFTILFRNLPLKESWQVVQGAHAWPILIAGISLFAVHFWTWTSHVYMLRILKKPQPPFWFFRAILLSQVLGMFAPGKIGDLSIAWFLRKRGLTYGEGLAIGVYYKMVALAVTFWLGMLVLFKSTNWLGIFLFILTLPIGLIVISKAMAKWVIPHLPRLMPHSKLAQETQTFSAAWHTLSDFRPNLMGLLLALLKTLNMTLTPWLLLQALGHPVAFSTTLTLSAITRLAAMVPISPSGLGVRELSGAIVFSQLAGVPWAVAASMMIVSTVMQYIVAAMCYGVGVSSSSNPSEKSQ
jgi:glycosyltransferase 2 family protein